MTEYLCFQEAGRRRLQEQGSAHVIEIIALRLCVATAVSAVWPHVGRHVAAGRCALRWRVGSMPTSHGQRAGLARRVALLAHLQQHVHLLRRSTPSFAVSSADTATAATMSGAMDGWGLVMEVFVKL